MKKVFSEQPLLCEFDGEIKRSPKPVFLPSTKPLLRKLSSLPYSQVFIDLTFEAVLSYPSRMFIGANIRRTYGLLTGLTLLLRG